MPNASEDDLEGFSLHKMTGRQQDIHKDLLFMLLALVNKYQISPSKEFLDFAAITGNVLGQMFGSVACDKATLRASAESLYANFLVIGEEVLELSKEVSPEQPHTIN